MSEYICNPCNIEKTHIHNREKKYKSIGETQSSRDSNKHVTKHDIKMAHKNVKVVQHDHSLGECKSKSLPCTINNPRMAIKLTTPSCLSKRTSHIQLVEVKCRTDTLKNHLVWSVNFESRDFLWVLKVHSTSNVCGCTCAGRRVKDAQNSIFYLPHQLNVLIWLRTENCFP